MLPTKKLILGLRETAQELREHPERHDWRIVEKCNCGLLAKNLGLPMPIYFRCAWASAVNRGFCEVTGQPTTDVFEYLAPFGLDKTDFKSIETLDNSPAYIYEDPLHVAQWMDQKADELEQRRIEGKEICIHEPTTK
jgi:hypothetical protein